MAIDLSTERLVSLREAARLLPSRRQGKRPHISCLYRWTKVGCRGVVLEFVNVGGTRCTSHEALARFIERVTVAERTAEPSRTLDARSMDIKRVEQQLDAEGIRQTPPQNHPLPR
jgi:hypothetical protein